MSNERVRRAGLKDMDGDEPLRQRQLVVAVAGPAVKLGRGGAGDGLKVAFIV